MKSITNINPAIAIFAITFYGLSASAMAADVDVRLSTKEGWVGMPIILQLSINDAADYEQPTLPEIDGCDIRSAGVPSQSSQITIINGRQTQKSSVVMQYLITPRREGTFEIPPLTIRVDGRNVTTDKLRFVASKSETGNLLFVEIHGAKDKVFVGQPLEMTLKIWIKPFQDKGRNLTLSEGDMWQMISDSTSWGSFADRMKELAGNNQRPGGREVLRDDGQGNERSYYLYEISATVYPKRPGKIDAEDVQIVVNYPTELGKARDPFADFFGDRGFGGGSPLSQMMDDDFFSSPFGNRLTVSATRPIVGEASVDSTEVLPVPSEGRPADYRGAVGRYNIVTQATPTDVNAGDPITLNIGIAGTGPMELVQAPPLSELPALTADFKVADQSLPGFVQDDTKLFSTTIRPRHEGITQIPPVPFSFFDPATEKYETVMSQPISINVKASESLSLDAIVGQSHRNNKGATGVTVTNQALKPDFINDNSVAVLVPQSPANSTEWWWSFVFAPPVVWLVTVLVRHRDAIIRWLPDFQSPSARCRQAIARADESADIVAALTRFIGSRTRQDCANSATAIGALRTAGLSQVAIDVEAFFQRCEQSSFNATTLRIDRRGFSSVVNVPSPPGQGEKVADRPDEGGSRYFPDSEIPDSVAFSGDSQHSLTEIQQRASELVEQIASAIDSTSKSQVRRSKRTETRRQANIGSMTGTTQRTSMILLATVFFAWDNLTLASGWASALRVSQPGPQRADAQPLAVPSLLAAKRIVDASADDAIQLSPTQQQSLLTEAGDMYEKAMIMAKTDSAEATELFTAAAQKYQMLVDSGVQNARLYSNLGNAYLQCSQLGRAIANYERASQLAPHDRQLAKNLEFAVSLVRDDDGSSDLTTSSPVGNPASLHSIIQTLRDYNTIIVRSLGLRTIIGVLILSSLLFWGIHIARALGYRFAIWRYSIIPLILLMISLSSTILTSAQPRSENRRIIVTDNLLLRTGDGDQFDAVVALDSAQGHRVQILVQRGNWLQVRTRDGHVGWLPSRDLEAL